MFKRILIPTDGSRLSKKAIAQAVRLAGTIGASVVGFHARPTYPVIAFSEGATLPPEFFDQWDHDTKRAGANFLGHIEAAARKAKVTFKGVQGSYSTASDGVIRVAKRERCDLIVMGAHGRNALARLLLGSETNRVLIDSKIPVLVIR